MSIPWKNDVLYKQIKTGNAPVICKPKRKADVVGDGKRKGGDKR